MLADQPNQASANGRFLQLIDRLVEIEIAGHDQMCARPASPAKHFYRIGGDDT